MLRDFAADALWLLGAVFLTCLVGGVGLAAHGVGLKPHRWQEGGGT